MKIPSSSRDDENPRRDSTTSWKHPSARLPTWRNLPRFGNITCMKSNGAAVATYTSVPFDVKAVET